MRRSLSNWIPRFLLLVFSSQELPLVVSFLPCTVKEAARNRPVFGVSSQVSEGIITQVGPNVGSGSYGTVHFLTLDDGTQRYIGKRPWRQDELTEAENPKERATRCLYYWQVEAHCLQKLPPHPQLVPYVSLSKDDLGREWMVFDVVGGDDMTPAPTLGDLLQLDAQEHTHTLRHVSHALLGCVDDNEDDSCYADTVDRIMESLLQILQHVHEHQVVHRDIKPHNLLVHNQSLILMDFGSAADLEPNGLFQQRKGLENGSRVAVSPIYAAPETFVDLNRSPLAFDLFSSGLLVCQVLFGFLEERMDAGFHQQLREAEWDLNLWLSNELGSKLRPAGLDNALEYLSERPGLWSLLEGMLQEDPTARPTAEQALRRFRKILKGDEEFQDGPFFTMVVESLELCEIPTMSRPLHYVATFNRREPLGLVLSEIDDTEENPLWKEATKGAQKDEVFVKEVLEGGQADLLGIIEVGDRLQGIGDLSFLDGGFEKALEMLQDQPRNAKFVKLHFDRLRVRENEAIPMIPSSSVGIHIVDIGAWSTKGKRTANEDTFVLHEIQDTKDRSVLLAGVFDGHGGTAASSMVSNALPSVLSKQLLLVDRQSSVPQALEDAWNTVCRNYQMECRNQEACVADYDAREGILLANTGSSDLIAGTTATMLALDERTAELTALNCGDSRSLVVTPEGKVQFATLDHTPQTESTRLERGVQEEGLVDYSMPECGVGGKWTLSVGDYEYSVGRSLEGPFATSKGIISEPDVTTVSVGKGEILLCASDGLWEVMDSEEVALDLHKMRRNEGLSAGDAAKALCSMALRKGSSDNVSAVVVYL